MASVTNFIRVTDGRVSVVFNPSRMAKEDKSKGKKANRSATWVVKSQLNIIKVTVQLSKSKIVYVLKTGTKNTKTIKISCKAIY